MSGLGRPPSQTMLLDAMLKFAEAVTDKKALRDLKAATDANLESAKAAGVGKDLAKAKEKVVAAQTEAERIRAAADEYRNAQKAEADKLVSDAEKIIRERKAELDGREADLKNLKQGLNSRQAELDRREAGLSERVHKLDEREAELARREAEVEEQRKKFKAALG